MLKSLSFTSLTIITRWLAALTDLTYSDTLNGCVIACCDWTMHSWLLYKLLHLSTMTHLMCTVMQVLCKYSPV